jgi:FkbM family methyltransferase
MTHPLRRYIQRKLREHGWLVRRLPPDVVWEAARAYWDADYIRRHKFHPATIVDVGVADGTGSLYEAFPDAYLVLVEPLTEFAGNSREILAKRNGRHIPMALGGAQGSKTIFVEPGDSLKSSFYERCEIERTGEVRIAREVEVTTLDAIASEFSFPRPYGLKLDTEGMELEILSGASNFLRDTIFVIAEVSVAHRFEGSYSFEQLIGRMSESGFEVCDLLDIGRAGPSADVTFIDLLFRRRAT